MTPSLDNSSRLSALKNGGKRRVKNDEEAFDLDVSGSAPIEPRTQNVPELDMGGELSAQSYDVRANQVITPDMQQEMSNVLMGQDPNVMRRLSAGLRGNAQPVTPQEPPIETRQVDRHRRSGRRIAFDRECPFMQSDNFLYNR